MSKNLVNHGVGRSAAAYDMNEVQKHSQNLDSLTSFVTPNMSAEDQARWNEWTSWAKNVIQQPGGAVSPQTAQTTSIAPGVTSMFNSPENIKRIADLLSKADSGHPIDEVMEEIRASTGLSTEAFWSELSSSIARSAGENPFAKKDDESDDKSEDKAEDKDDKKEDKKDSDSKEKNPFEKKDDKGESKDDKKDEPKSESKKESKPEPKKESKKDEDDEPGTPEWEKKDMRLAKDALKKLKELMKREKKEREGAEVAQIEEAMAIIEKLMKGEAEEAASGGHDIPGPEGEEIELEKIGPDVPPALEGLALPLPDLPKPLPGPESDDSDGMRVIDMAPPVKPLIAASFKLHDRVWRKADFESGFETVGDEPGRIVEFGNGKAIVDWGHDDGVPTEELPSDLMLASKANADEAEMFPRPSLEPEADVEPLVVNHGTMGMNDHAERVLRETSLHDILAKNAKDEERAEDTIRHLASGKDGKILQRLAGGRLRVSVDGKELDLWPYEVE